MRGEEKRLEEFRSVVWKYWKENGRHELPWRKTKDPYKILVSEVMLQQTQVSRVLEKYNEFVKRFPTVRSLAQAQLSDVLKLWGGMGYNRRAKFLKDTAQKIVDENGGRVPKALTPLQKLPGIGPYTAAAVRIFAFNEPDTMVETNIRAAFIHHFFHDAKAIADTDVLPLLKEAAEGQDPRTWHWALMDYGAHLKHSGVRNNQQSKHYSKQSKFEGSLRQVRGAILRELHNGSQSLKYLTFEREKIDSALASLSRDGLITQQKGKSDRSGWRIA